MAQYDTNGDGVIRWGEGGGSVLSQGGEVMGSKRRVQRLPSGLAAPSTGAAVAAAAAGCLSHGVPPASMEGPDARRCSFEEFVRMSQDKIFLTGKLQEYQNAFRY